MELDFDLHKKNVLSREDKSRKGSWDEKITELCNTINNNDNYCTTSSCSGRILIISKNSSKKHDVDYIFVSHEKISTRDIIGHFENSDNNKVFQIQSAIIHVLCKDIESARLLMQKARDCGFRRSGIININPYTVEIISDDSIQIPMILPKELLNSIFYDNLCKISNDTLEITWNKIKRLVKEL